MQVSDNDLPSTQSQSQERKQRLKMNDPAVIAEIHRLKNLIHELSTVIQGLRNALQGIEWDENGSCPECGRERTHVTDCLIGMTMAQKEDIKQ